MGLCQRRQVVSVVEDWWFMTSQTFLATEKRALDPAEIEEFYSTISA